MENNSVERTLRIALFLTSLFFIVEVVGGLISGSLSLLGDAGHMFRDLVSLLITLSALRIAKKLPTRKKTFGYHRVEILAALFNGLMLIAVSIWIIWEAYERFLNPQSIKSTVMLIVAVIGLIVNSYVALRLHGSSDLNVRSAFLHVLTDTLASVAVIIASIWIFFTGKTIIDPVLSVIIAVFVLFSAFTILRDSVYILLEFSPRDIDLDELIEEVESIEDVEGIHDIHLWSLCSNINVMEAHIFTGISDMRKIENIKRKIKKELEKYNIKHSTLEFECEECTNDDKIHRLKH